ncbi:MAG: limonene-1,2-epoxide hydrolase family protein [Gammaproteobacteria bacterium]
MSPVQVVEAFVAAWNRMDLDGVLGLLHQEIAYHNGPLDPLYGKAAVSEYLRSRWIFEEIDWEMPNIAANGNTVLTERVDRFVLDGRPVALPVMGAFGIRDDAIVAWRDYFDLAGWRAQLAPC